MENPKSMYDLQTLKVLAVFTLQNEMLNSLLYFYIYGLDRWTW